MRHYRHQPGNPTRAIRIKANELPSESMETKIGKNIQPQANGCWLWKGNADEYGLPGYLGIVVHRFVYQTLIGPIPAEHVLHHTCENKGCCNPLHLVPMLNGDHISHHAALRRQARGAA